MPRPSITVKPTIEVRARTRRPPLQCVALLAEPEADFRLRVQELEEQDLFRKLLREGVVRRRGARGRMPPERYEEYMSRQLVRFVERHDLDRRPQWREDFVRARTEEEVAELAARYRVPTGELGRIVRYLRAQEGHATPTRSGGESAHDVADFVAGSADADLTLPIEVVRHFVEAHGLTENDLVTDFLHGETGDAVLLEKYSTTPAELAAVREAVNTVMIADAAAGPSLPPPAPRHDGAEPVRPTAIVTRDHRGATLQLLGDAGYALHYVINPELLDGESLPREQRTEASALLDELRWVNQRRSLVCRVIAYLFAHQRRYFAAGDELALRPLGQAQLARALDEHPSSICRVLPDKYLQTPEGLFELKHFCQSKREVVRRLAVEYSQLSDRELQGLLEQNYDCKIARRTVAYHRGEVGRS